MDASKLVVLKVNDVSEAQQNIALASGKSQVVNFKVAKATPGTYNVSVAGLSSSFQVQEAAATGNQSNSQVQAAATGNQSNNDLSLPVIGIILVGGLLVIVFVIILVIRQRSSY